MEELPQLKVSSGWIELELLSEPTLKLTVRGYAPILTVKARKTGLMYSLYISAKSIADAIEPLRKANGNLFTGLTIRLRKENSDKMSPYIVEALE